MSKVLYNYESFKDKEDGCRCTLCSGYFTPMHFHNCMEILYIKEGELECTIDDTTYIAQKDDIVFVKSRSLHSFRGFDESDYKYYCIVIGDSFTTDYAHLFQTKSFPCFLTDKNFNRQLRLYFELLEANRDKSFLVKKGFMNIIVGKLIEYYRLETIRNKEAKHVNALVNILDYINEHYSEPITLDSLSKTFGYNKYYFSRLFNTHIGDNINEYLTMIRLRHVISDYHLYKNLTEVVYACGFNSMTSFYRAFSQFYKETPTSYFKRLEKDKQKSKLK